MRKKDYGYGVYISGKEEEIGKVKYNNWIVTVEGEATDLKFFAPRNSYAFGVLLLTNIPKEYRYIIMSELLRKR